MKLFVEDLHNEEFSYCHRGCRAFFKRYGLIPWSQFVREGLDAEAFLATGDAMAVRAVRHKERKVRDDGRG